MENSKIEIWLSRVFGHEGGYSNRNPEDDPGGETRWGISKRSYPDLDIKNLTKEAAVSIYKNDFLLPILKDNIKDGVIYQLLDFGVHSGISRAIKELQKIVGVKPDGVIGPITQAAINRHSESDLIQLILSARLYYLTSLSNWPSNSRGWARRIARNLYHGADDS